MLQKIYDYLIKKVFIIYIYLLGIVLPLFFHDHYFDIMRAKAEMFIIIALVLIGPILGLLIIKIIIHRFKFDNFFIPLILLLISVSASTLSSNNIASSFYGSQGWHIGLLTFLFLIVSIILFGDVEIDHKYFLPLIITNIFIYVCGILHGFEIDIFNLHNNILDVSWHKFTSTIGNINWYTGYLSLSVFAFCGLYITYNKLIYCVGASLGVISIAMLGSDGIFLGIGILSFFAIPYILNKLEHVKRFSILILMFTLGLYIARKLDYCMDGYAAELRRMLVILPLLMLGIILLALSYLIKLSFYEKYKKLFIYIFESLLLISALVFAYITIQKADADWATGRLSLWIDSLKIFVNFPPKNKLFGIGLEQLKTIYAFINEKYGANYLSSHSEYVHLLLTGGFASLFSYISCWFYIFYDYLKNKRWNNKNVFIYLGLICYFGQTIINSATTCNVALLSILIILFVNNKNKSIS